MERSMAESCKKVLIFGRTGDGKSTVANMLVSGTLENPLFPMGDSMVGVTENCMMRTGSGYEVVDTIGLGEETDGKRRHAKDLILEFLKRTKGNYDQIIFVKRAGRFDNLDSAVWKIFLEIFRPDSADTSDDDRYRGIVVVLTKCRKTWIEENEAELKKRYAEANSRFIPVDFPPTHDDEEIEALLPKIREASLQTLRTRLELYSKANGDNFKFVPGFANLNDEDLSSFAGKIWNFLKTMADGITEAGSKGLDLLFKVALGFNPLTVIEFATNACDVIRRLV